jgi:spore coat protein H
MKKSGLIFLALALAAVAGAPAELNQTNRPVVNYTNFEPNLPVIFLQTTQRIPSEVKVPCVVGMVLPSEAKSGKTNALPGLVRIHGASSQRYSKKSLGLTLDAPARWLGMRESKSWVLNAAFVDRSLMRHKLSYDLFRSLSVSNAPRFASASRFVEVNLNGRYHGVFLLMERVDRALLELRRYDSNAASQACIYKAVDHPANFSQPGHPGYEQREPEPEVREYWGPMDEFNQFVSSATDPEFFHPETGITSRLDLDNAIDFHLLVLLTSNMDGIDKNFIIARNAPTPATPKPRFFFAPWDYDATFGRNWEASRVEATAWQSNHLFNRLLSNQDCRKKFAARWQHLRNRQFSVANIERLMDENARTLGAAVRRNEARWKTLTGPYPDRLGFEDDIKEMKEWTAARLEWLDQEIARRCGGAPATGQ